ncbi:PREDICTED: probable cellulose synthase A catalytic subunit 6 [UDP-forming] isoform X2 [Nicotiana attenuata]|uniref:probable cellulose synthase A catalytic subunit 6 [UDP-forming] isoform X2 n=1 Tax=Nicotiana attenuata TaxID=49451 RepID=UPI000904C6AA|nr:PREDICTED: probable cellulose synthase A catalytic subunit 6 [UDP-forming] isoform X2 [Nicotiana attenuata]
MESALDHLLHFQYLQQSQRKLKTKMETLPLQECRVHKNSAIIHRTHTLLHSIFVLSMFYYRLIINLNTIPLSFFPYWLLIFTSELILSFLWLLNSADIWAPVSRSVFPERLPPEDELPAIDVFVSTADPKTEPPLGVMNTILSVLALNYPIEKLSVYLSDDGGSNLTFYAINETWKFAEFWVPFCRKFEIKRTCPEAYFQGVDEINSSKEFLQERENIQKEYLDFKERLKKAQENEETEDTIFHFGPNRDTVIEIIGQRGKNSRKVKLPLLVYVSREKNPAHPHHFKAGALNVLVKWPGMDGLIGPILSGTCFYMKRKALYGAGIHKDMDISELKKCFGSSNEFLNTLTSTNHKQNGSGIKEFADNKIQEAKILASCTYEMDSQWGNQIGFLYHSVTEDYFTSFILHCKGWRSVFYNPTRPAFLGSATTNLNDTLVQGTRWSSGLTEVLFSRFCPLIYGLISRMPLLECMCYAYLASQPLYCLPAWFLAIIPQLCLLNGIPIYPKVSSPWFMVYLLLFLSTLGKYLWDVVHTGGTMRTWWNEWRVWMIKSITAYFYGSLDAILKLFGFRKASFLPTNKVVDNEQLKRYQMGIYDFQASKMLIVPLVTLVTLNMVSFVLGSAKVIFEGRLSDLFGQVFISFFILVVNYPIIEGMIFRKDKGSVPLSVTLLSIFFCILLLFLGSIFVM